MCVCMGERGEGGENILSLIEKYMFISSKTANHMTDIVVTLPW